MKSFASCTITRRVGKPWQRVVHNIEPGTFGVPAVGFVTINGMEVTVQQTGNYTWKLISPSCKLSEREKFVNTAYPVIY